MLSGAKLCRLSETDKIPKFFRVTDRDLVYFPSNSFTSLKLDSGENHCVKVFIKDTQFFLVTPLTGNSFNVSIKIGIEFYYNEYDWGLIYRKVGGDSKEHDKFYKVRFLCRILSVML